MLNGNPFFDLFNITGSREAFIALTIGLVSTALFAKTAISIGCTSSSQQPTTSKAIMPLQCVQPSEVFTDDELSTLTTCWNEVKPQGNFLQDRHGFTHYKLDGVENGPSAKGMVVICHGLGTSFYAFENFSTELVNAGYSVLKYDYYGHGYSKYCGGEDMWVDYTPDMFVDQLEDLLEHVEKEEGGKPVAVVAHSTGGIVCTAANDRWSKVVGSKRGIIPKLVLVAPAFYCKKVSGCSLIYRNCSRFIF